jgi:hypothetical protein
MSFSNKKVYTASPNGFQRVNKQHYEVVQPSGVSLPVEKIYVVPTVASTPLPQQSPQPQQKQKPSPPIAKGEFDLRGCSSVNDIYTKNSDKIKLEDW